MGRRAYNVLAGISLMCSVATCVVWMRSRFEPLHVGGDLPGKRQLCAGEWGVTCCLGRINLFVQRLGTPRRFPTRRAFEVGGQRGVWLAGPPTAASHLLCVDWARRSTSDIWMGMDGERVADGSEGGSGTILPGSSLYVASPLWPAVVGLGLLPLAWLVRVRRGRRRSQTAFCSDCGYDLRATRNRCPECGRTPTT